MKSQNLLHQTPAFGGTATANVSLYVAYVTGILNIQLTAVGTYLYVALSCILDFITV